MAKSMKFLFKMWVYDNGYTFSEKFSPSDVELKQRSGLLVSLADKLSFFVCFFFRNSGFLLRHIILGVLVLFRVLISSCPSLIGQGLVCCFPSGYVSPKLNPTQHSDSYLLFKTCSCGFPHFSFSFNIYLISYMFLFLRIIDVL